ncbi:hypothetical protein [Azospirillum sp.]|uniref:hypothetical protein n=1 Tax=Azospirillum sp. TaxID=34012 RepID=UPI003D7630F2
MNDLLAPIEWKHDALADDLAAHLDGPERLVWTNMQLGPSGSPRPDVYTIPRVYSRFTPLAYEVKVSVADFRSDVTSGKWQSYLAFACAVVFAVPAGLVGKGDIPPGCGLMARGPGGWRMIKAPTLKVLDNLPLPAWQKLMLDGLERMDRRRAVEPRDISRWRTRDTVSREIGNDVADLFRDADTVRKAATELLSLTGRPDKADGSWGLTKAIQTLAYHGKQVKETWAALAGVLGISADAWPDWGSMEEAKKRISRLKPGADAGAVRQQLGYLRSQIDRMERDLVGDPAPVTRAPRVRDASTTGARRVPDAGATPLFPAPDAHQEGC